jgi:hypothetical protein
MAWIMTVCNSPTSSIGNWIALPLVDDYLCSYNGTSDLQLERMNVYLNEVNTTLVVSF